MELIIDNKIIRANMYELLSTLKQESGGYYLHDIEKEKNDNVQITCPWHKDGQESHPSCSVYTRYDDPDVMWGTAYCFTCKAKMPLFRLVSKCFGETDDNFGKQWLVDRFGDTFYQVEEYLEPIVLDPPKKEEKFLDESILDKYSYHHPYMDKRHLTPYVLQKFKIGYNPETESITMPVWDDKGRLVMVTERSVVGKRFHLEKDVVKPVYLLNEIKKQRIQSVYVCESQINTLTIWGWGYPAIGLFGTGSEHQYDLLKKSGITSFFLCLDGDSAGRNGTRKFIEKMPKDVLINVVQIPNGKDVNDLTQEEFMNLPIYDSHDWVRDARLFN